MKKKNILAIAMATAMLASAGLTACGSESDKIVISVINFGGGVGKLWLTDAMERFTAAVENKTYGTKTGVEFDEPQNQQSINTANIRSFHSLSRYDNNVSLRPLSRHCEPSGVAIHKMQS